jgi:hypothetical protein
VAVQLCYAVSTVPSSTVLDPPAEPGLEFGSNPLPINYKALKAAVVTTIPMLFLDLARSPAPAPPPMSRPALAACAEGLAVPLPELALEVLVVGHVGLVLELFQPFERLCGCMLCDTLGTRIKRGMLVGAH